MRTDIYSFHQGPSDFQIEIHSTGKKDKTQQEFAKDIAGLIQSFETDRQSKVQRVIVDQDWKKVQITDEKGNKTTHRIEKLRHAHLNTDTRIQVKTAKVIQPILLASTENTTNAPYIKASLIEKSFQPITPMEKIWKLINTLMHFIRMTAREENKSIGSFDFATHLFSQDAFRKQLHKEEIKSSTLIKTLCNFFKESNISPATIESTKQAAHWAESIENLRKKSRSTILSGYESIAKEMHERLTSLKEGESMLIPFSCYVGEQGERIDSMRLVKLTHQRENSYTLTFIDGQDNPPIEGISRDKLNVETFFKPLVDLQLPASYFEAPHSFIESITLWASKLFIAHPHICTWVLMRDSPSDERKLANAMFDHAVSTGLVSPETTGERRTNLRTNKLRELFGQLLTTEPKQFNQALFEPTATFAQSERIIDSFLPLVSQKEQAKVEATSLFRLYYASKESLSDAPATIAVLENGLSRVSEQYERLSIHEPETVEMLRVIRTHIDKVKNKEQPRAVNVTEKLTRCSLPDTFKIDPIGKEYFLQQSASTLRPESTQHVPSPLALPRASLESQEQREIHKSLTALNVALQATLAEIGTAKNLEASFIAKSNDFRQATKQSLDNLIKVIEELPLENTQTIKDELKAIGEAIIVDKYAPGAQLEQLSSRYQGALRQISSKIADARGKVFTAFLQQKETLKRPLQQKIQELKSSLTQTKPAIIQELEKLYQTRPDLYQHAIQSMITKVQKDENISGELIVYDIRIPGMKQHTDLLARANELSTLVEDIDQMNDPYSCRSFLSSPSAQRHCADIPHFQVALDTLRSLDGFVMTVDSHLSLIRDFQNIAYNQTNSALQQRIEELHTRLQAEIDKLQSDANISDNEFQALQEWLKTLQFRESRSINEQLQLFKGLKKTLESLQIDLEKIQYRLKNSLQRPDHSELLGVLQSRIADCQQYEGNILRNEISSILAALPIDDLDSVQSFWSTRPIAWEEQIKAVVKLLLKAYPEDQQHLSTFRLQLALAGMILFKINPTSQQYLEEASQVLNDEYLRFYTPTEQQQFLAIKKSVDLARHVKTSLEFIYNKGSTFTADKRSPFFPCSLGTVPKPIEPISSQNKRSQPKSSLYFDYESSLLLDRYLANRLNENSSEDRLQFQQPTGAVKGTDLYKLFCTNSPDSHLGLVELLSQVCSPELLPILNNIDDKMHIQLRRVIENRVLRPGHLQELLQETQHQESLMNALNAAIESASIQYPYAYVTLVSLKTILLTFTSENSQQLLKLIDSLTINIASDDPKFKDIRLALHVARLKAYTLLTASNPAFKLDKARLATALDSWFAYKNAISLGYTDRQEAQMLTQFFYGSLLGIWNSLTDSEKKETLSQILVSRKLVSPQTRLDWRNQGEVFTVNLPSGTQCQVGIQSSSLTENGVPLGVSSDALEEMQWKQFPLWSPNFKPVGLTKLPNTEPLTIYQFGVAGLNDRQFQMATQGAKVTFSVEIKDKNGQVTWHAFTPLERMEKDTPEVERGNKPEGMLQAFFSSLKKPLIQLGRELALQKRPSQEAKAVPADLVQQGVWINKKNPRLGVVLNEHAEELATVKLSHAKQKNQNTTRVEEVSIIYESKELRLVNSAKSSLYRHLTGLTSADNIKIWADVKGQTQVVELLDPKMTFKFDPKAQKLMSQELEGYFISENQSIPVGDFASDWRNYLILTNESGDRRLIMRQSAITASYFISEDGYERGLVPAENKARKQIPPFIDVRLVEHPEKGFAIAADKPQANLYLALACMQSNNFKQATKYIRAAVRSSPYSGIEQELIEAIFAYKNDSFNPNKFLASGSEDSQGFLGAMLSLSKHIRAQERFLPAIAAAKLSTLAAVLEQDLSHQDSLKTALPSEAEVASWLALYYTPEGVQTNLETVNDESRLNSEELRRIFLQYPNVTRTHAANVNKLLGERIGVKATTTQLASTTVPKSSPKYDQTALVKELSTASQTSKKEQVMIFYAGDYIIRHFKEIYEKINQVDGSTENGRTALQKIIHQLSQYQDVSPAKKMAIDMLKNFAEVKYKAKVTAEQIEMQVAQNAISQHLALMQDTRDSAVRQYKDLLSLLDHGPGGNRDLFSQEALKTLEGLIEELNKLQFQAPSQEELNSWSLEQLHKYKSVEQDKLADLLYQLATQVSKSAKRANALVGVTPKKKPKERLYPGAQNETLSKSEISEIRAWVVADDANKPPTPKAFQRIKLHATYTLADHIRDKEQYPCNYPIHELLSNVVIGDSNPIQLQPIGSVRTSWSSEEVTEIHTIVQGLLEGRRIAKKVSLQSTFPALKKDKADDVRIRQFLHSHDRLSSQFAIEDTISNTEAVEEKEVRVVKRPEEKLTIAKTPEEARKIYSEVQKKIQADPTLIIGYYYRSETIPFFDKLSDAELLACSKIDIDKEVLTLIENQQFTSRPNAYENLQQFLLRKRELSNPLSVAIESMRLRNEIQTREHNENKQLLPQKEGIKMQEKGESLFSSPIIPQAVNDLPECAEKTKKLEGIQLQKVNTLRHDILELANTLPLDQTKRSAEELRRLRGAASTIDIERIFQLYAKDRLGELKDLNPSLTDDHISKLCKIVTEHHLEATKLQTLSRISENIETAARLLSKFKNTPFAAQIADAIKAFLDNKNSEPANKLIEQLTLSKEVFQDNYSAQQCAQEFRDCMAAIESYIRNFATKRYYDPNHDHPHTRAALAYENTLGVVFRKHQIQEFTARVGSPDIVTWLGTGFGKTFMAPGLAKMMATGTNLVCVIDTKDLIPTTSKTRDQDSRAVYGQAAYHFQFERDPDRSVENLEEIEHRLLTCIHEEGYVVTSKEAIGSLVLQMLTWQRLSVKSNKYDKQIAVIQRIISLFQDRALALGDEIHLILNIIEALDYAEGDQTPLKEYAEYYETMSDIYHVLYSQDPRSKQIASLLKIAENRQAQVDLQSIRKAMQDLAALFIDQSSDPRFQPKAKIHHVIAKLLLQGVTKEQLGKLLTVTEDTSFQCPAQVHALGEDEKRRIACLKENLSNTFESVMKKIADDDFGISSDGISICPYSKGRPQPTKEFDNIFQTLQVHYMWYQINGIPFEGLKKQIHTWNIALEQELAEYEKVEECPSYKNYREIFGPTAPPLRNLDDSMIKTLASNSKGNTQLLHCFLEKCVLPNQTLFPSKLGFSSMDLVSLFHKFGGYAGTIETRSTFHRAVTNKDDPDVDKGAEQNFKVVYENPKNQTQYHLPDLDNPVMKEEAKKRAVAVPSLSFQLSAGNINLKEYRAIIDAGGLFKELDYRDMARDILNQFSETELQAVLIYNDKSELVILRRGSDNFEAFDPKSTPPEPDMRFTIYRQPQFTGADIPQGQHIKALLTINEKTTWGDFQQAAGRLRKNKEGQTFAVIYRDSLLGNSDKIDVKALTQGIEKNELKQRRYYAAVAELESILLHKLRRELCGEQWKVLFPFIEKNFFQPSIKTPDQLLEISQPQKPLDLLMRYRKQLIETIDELKTKDLPNSSLRALDEAHRELSEYKLPKAEEMPETVLGTASSSTKETEVSKEVSKEVEAEKSAESITVQELQSIEYGKSDGTWIKWKPADITSLLTGNAIRHSFVVSNDAPRLFEHFRRASTENYSRFFTNISVTQNTTQNRTFGSQTNISFLSQGQKIVRSVAEISVVRNGVRNYHQLFLDVADRKTFQESLQRAAAYMTDDVKHFAAKNPNISLRALSNNPQFQALFGEGRIGRLNMEFFVDFIGPNFSAGDLSSLSIRLNTDGRYLASCGALSLEDTDDSAQALMVRSKILRGDLSFTVKERKIMTQIIEDEYLGVTDFTLLQKELKAAQWPEDKIQAAIQKKKAQGIQDYRDLSFDSKKILRMRLLELFKLYQAAVRYTRPSETININNTHFGMIARRINEKLNTTSF